MAGYLLDVQAFAPLPCRLSQGHLSGLYKCRQRRPQRQLPLIRRSSEVPLRNELDAGYQAAPSALSIDSIEGVNFAQLVDKPATQVDQSPAGATQSIDEAVVQEQAASPVGKSRRSKNPVRRALDFSRTVWKAYNRTLESQPILVKSATSFFGFMIGDLLAQTIVGNPYNIWRTGRLCLFGVLMDGPIGHLWYTLLDKNIEPTRPKSNKAVLLKMLADQILWAPFFSCVFFAFTKTLERRPDMIIPSIMHKLVPMLLANYAVWPIAHIINFRFIPSSQRILYINLCQIMWSAYMSNMSVQTVRARR